MSKGLIKAGLRALSEPGALRPSKDLLSYLQENNILVTPRGSRIVLGTNARAQLERAMERDFQVAPGTTADAWEGISRTEALDLGLDEKASNLPVRGDRVAIKAFGGQAVRMRGKDFLLPDGVNLDVPVSAAADFSDHLSVVLVENWEAFERIHALSFEVPVDLQGAAVVYRGQPGGFTIGAARRFLSELKKPVSVFPDIDPAGLRIALETPGFAGLMLPDVKEVETMFRMGRGLSERYTSQLTGSGGILESAVPDDVMSFWTLIKQFGRGIPQEEFVRP